MPGRKLDNVPENPCIGCGPAHPFGLRLAFEESDGTVTTTLDATPERVGWPGRLHTGVLYLALLETANWTLYGARSRVGIPSRTSHLALTRVVPEGERLLLRGRLLADDAASALVEAEALDAQGGRVARLERAFDLVDRATFLARMGYDELPPGLEGCLP